MDHYTERLKYQRMIYEPNYYIMVHKRAFWFDLTDFLQQLQGYNINLKKKKYSLEKKI